MNHNTLADEIVVEITPEEYQADLARGLQPDEILLPGQHKFQRGGFLKRDGLTPTQRVISVKVCTIMEK